MGPRYRSLAVVHVTAGAEPDLLSERGAAEYLWPNVDKNGPVHPKLGTRCWPWKGWPPGGGYGKVLHHGREIIASRYALELRVGPLAGHAMACHRCNNPPCCNPDHLYVGDALSNAADRERARAERDAWDAADDLARAAIASAP